MNGKVFYSPCGGLCKHRPGPYVVPHPGKQIVFKVSPSEYLFLLLHPPFFLYPSLPPPTGLLFTMKLLSAAFALGLAVVGVTAAPVE